VIPDPTGGEHLFLGTKAQLREFAYNMLAVSDGNTHVQHDATRLVEVGTKCSKRLIEHAITGYKEGVNEDKMTLDIFQGLLTEQPPDLNAAMLTAVLIQVSRDTFVARQMHDWKI
jgi:hypothetical protein